MTLNVKTTLSMGRLPVCRRHGEGAVIVGGEMDKNRYFEGGREGVGGVTFVKGVVVRVPSSLLRLNLRNCSLFCCLYGGALSAPARRQVDETCDLQESQSYGETHTARS